MIISKKAITMAETQEIVKGLEEKNALRDYLKNFVKLNAEKSHKLIEEIRTLNNLKIKEDNIIKIADFLPNSKEELGKIFNDVSLSEEETNVILEIIKKYAGE